MIKASPTGSLLLAAVRCGGDLFVTASFAVIASACGLPDSPAGDGSWSADSGRLGDDDGASTEDAGQSGSDASSESSSGGGQGPGVGG